MDHHQHIKLTAAELSYLWNTYIADSMSICVFTYCLQHVEDEDIQSLISYSMDLSKQHVEIIHGIFTEENIPLPVGFTEKDVNLQAGRLFSDVFYLHYLNQMASGGLATYGRILQKIYRNDIRSFFSNCLESTIELNNRVCQLLLEKGLANRPPFIPYPETQEFVKKQSFFLEGLGRRDSLTGSEIALLHFNIQTNQLGSGLATAFSQVAESDKVRKYILRGKEIALKHVSVFSDHLKNHSLPIPNAIDQEIMNSTESPFSDKLLLFHYALMIYAGVGNYGVAISESRRSDLVVDFTRLSGEIMKFAEDGVNIMIENEWLEQAPLSPDRKSLMKDR